MSGKERGEPAVLLLSPSMQPVEDKGVAPTSSSLPSSSSGNMFTFFLTAPLLAFCQVANSSSKNIPKVLFIFFYFCERLYKGPYLSIVLCPVSLELSSRSLKALMI